MNNMGEFNMEDLFNDTLHERDEMQEPKVEQLMSKLRKLQEGNKRLREEVKELLSVSMSLQKELEDLQTETYKQEEVLKETEENDRKLQVQCEEFEQECVRQLNQNKKREELLEQYNCEIQEVKLKHRKQRMKFENQLLLLIEQHKNLHAVFSPERLADEIKIAENAKDQLLLAEKVKLDQLRCLDRELTTQEIGTAAAGEDCSFTESVSLISRASC
ncbi:synaptonemal complex central element protein 1 isoform X2 [Betta splendens]|uniref:Synaptonemal complex central element protein 1 isoform X2 n=1 Tax=Betta splendens TaxID=158456 RepID=A0A6P7NU99_BETSP|nr:synaptonemal complex central element protein 1 isoform X2 [Betta splendens]